MEEGHFRNRDSSEDSRLGGRPTFDQSQTSRRLDTNGFGDLEKHLVRASLNEQNKTTHLFETYIVVDGSEAN